MACLSVAVDPVAQEHHGHAGGAAFAAGSVLVKAVQTVQHGAADDLRRDIVPREEITDRMEHGGRAAVVFRQLVTQWFLPPFLNIEKQLFGISEQLLFLDYLLALVCKTAVKH